MRTGATDVLRKCARTLFILALCCGMRPAHGTGTPPSKPMLNPVSFQNKHRFLKTGQILKSKTVL